MFAIILISFVLIPVVMLSVFELLAELVSSCSSPARLLFDELVLAAPEVVCRFLSLVILAELDCNFWNFKWFWAIFIISLWCCSTRDKHGLQIVFGNRSVGVTWIFQRCTVVDKMENCENHVQAKLILNRNSPSQANNCWFSVQVCISFLHTWLKQNKNNQMVGHKRDQEGSENNFQMTFGNSIQLLK